MCVCVFNIYFFLSPVGRRDFSVRTLKIVHAKISIRLSTMIDGRSFLFRSSPRRAGVRTMRKNTQYFTSDDPRPSGRVEAKKKTKNK